MEKAKYFPLSSYRIFQTAVNSRNILTRMSSYGVPDIVVQSSPNVKYLNRFS